MTWFPTDRIDCPHFLRDLLTSSPQALFVCEPGGAILVANPGAETMFGHGAQSMTGKRLSMLFTPEDQDILYPNLLHLVAETGAVDEQAMLLRRSGTRFMAMLHLRGYDHPRGRLLLAHILDIDHEKQMEKLLQEIGYQDLLRVANGVGHEIRNPLLIIGGYLRKMYTSCKATDEDDTSYHCILDNLKKIENIVRKIDFFTNPPKPAFFSAPTELVVEMGVSPFSEELKASGVRCLIEVEPANLLMDQNLISRTLSILVENAADALHEGGEIRVTGATREPWYVFSVQDTGPGIPETDLASIFQPFFSTKTHSAGIDLAILKRIMDSHQGKVEVFSNVEKGTRFDLFLPLERRRLIRRENLAERASPNEPD
ncbi:PAS domain S-box-containing protein [Desulfonatronum zhilinae]|nr:PAS domain S-box-containing protein [Desulfonatronum zhilinae]